MNGLKSFIEKVKSNLTFLFCFSLYAIPNRNKS